MLFSTERYRSISSAKQKMPKIEEGKLLTTSIARWLQIMQLFWRLYMRMECIRIICRGCEQWSLTIIFHVCWTLQVTAVNLTFRAKILFTVEAAFMLSGVLNNNLIIAYNNSRTTRKFYHNFLRRYCLKNSSRTVNSTWTHNWPLLHHIFIAYLKWTTGLCFSRSSQTNIVPARWSASCLYSKHQKSLRHDDVVM